MQGETVAEVRARLQRADEGEFAVLERALVADGRKGVRAAVEAARRRLAAEAAERERLAGLYGFERALADARGASVVVGLDEVGRGPLAGPLAVGAVILGPGEPIAGLNDSKQLRPEAREAVAAEVRERALAWAVRYVEPAEIDAAGMTACLVTAFRRALAAVEETVRADLVLLDGNPLRLDPREANVVKGDGRCASIAAASVVAKVERDRLMEAYDTEYPGYGLAENKGYASPSHIAAIREHGLTPIHRASFCTAFAQPTLF
ncbi:ribonuclease HII [Adlercreutzia faecimuris]|uniref:Ribonuclease HII n=1 Tax=Adlercreutzia faecimuris TaxID=2897341 RepID=A0ABS9WG34_9ACTN|nr:ribonuclease HII [Adlercreutzia sp. JBNU-10]MCI2241827.1 ribonuclease HII [Adlercreutzia sp. JBNU-10]